MNERICLPIIQPDLSERWEIISIWPSLEISTHGLVRRRRDGRMVYLHKKPKGYREIRVRAGKKTQRAFVHRVVLVAFRPSENAQDLQVAHLDGNPSNNAIWNLKWVTAKENNGHKHIHGRLHAHSKLNAEAVRIIKREHRNHGLGLKLLAKKFGVCVKTIKQVRKGRTWSHVEELPC